MKLHKFNIISGFIIVAIMIFQLVEGSNNIPYFLIALFFIIYFFEMKFRSFRAVGITFTILLDIFSLWTLLPYTFAP